MSFMGGVPTAPSAASPTLSTCVLRSMRGTAKRVGVMEMVGLGQPSGLLALVEFVEFVGLVRKLHGEALPGTEMEMLGAGDGLLVVVGWELCVAGRRSGDSSSDGRN